MSQMLLFPNQLREVQQYECCLHNLPNTDVCALSSPVVNIYAKPKLLSIFKMLLDLCYARQGEGVHVHSNAVGKVHSYGCAAPRLSDSSAR